MIQTSFTMATLSLNKIKSSAHFQKYLLTGKVFIIGLISLFLMIPGAMVKGMMRERQTRSEEAKEAVQSMWSDKQTLVGPIIEIPYTEVQKPQHGVERKRTEYLYILPSQLEVQSTLTPELRRRGIFETVLYVAELELKGSFTPQELLPKTIPVDAVDWSKARVLVSVSDARGVKEAKLNHDKTTHPFQSHQRSHLGNGLEKVISCPISVGATEPVSFEIQMQLKGSEYFGLVPVGEHTIVEAKSSWHSPGFLGKFLPDQRDINDEGFSSSWTVSGLSRGLPPCWTGKSVALKQSELGLQLMMPVSAYAQSLRIVSYAFLFVCFTFGAMFCAERISGIAIHILQYAVTGGAIMLFYVLLLSLAEHLAFSLSYGIAATIILMMIVKYVSVIIRRKHLTLALVSMLVLLYGFFFVVLQCEDYALLMGSSGLVIIIATVMYLTRNLHETSPNQNV